MPETLIITPNQPKNAVYEEIYPQIKALVENETDLIANMANIASALKEVFGWWWVGFYLVKGNELVLGPFQGPIACTRIRFGKGVCGTSWKEKRSIFVPNVNKFPGHIACSSASVSEIVVPVFDENNDVFAVLDVDSERFDVLDKTDMEWLEQIAKLIKQQK
ncbi:MAG: GAF domain-containing protein [Porphyromonadaceae bacterium]|jgi:GAF domain-containing protein|nr:GAF domain-containing protein [Porphyromonadaceae bacterium]